MPYLFHSFVRDWHATARVTDACEPIAVYLGAEEELGPAGLILHQYRSWCHNFKNTGVIEQINCLTDVVICPNDVPARADWIEEDKIVKIHSHLQQSQLDNCEGGVGIVE